MTTLADLRATPQIKALLIGSPGAGKTVFATSFPYPSEIDDFDGKADSAALFYGKDPERLAGVTVHNYMPTAGEPIGQNYQRWYTRLVEREKAVAAGTFKIKTLIVDSITSFWLAMMPEVMRQNKTYAGKRAKVNDTEQPAQGDYGMLQGHFQNMVYRTLALPCNVIFIGHLQTEKSEMTGELLRGLAVPGKVLGPWMPVAFKESWRVYAEQVAGKTVRKAQTQSDAQYQFLRSQIPGLPLTLDITDGAKVLNTYLGAPLA